MNGWTEQARRTASDGRQYDLFGNSMAIGKDTVAVGSLFGNGTRVAIDGNTIVIGATHRDAETKRMVVLTCTHVRKIFGRSRQSW